MSYESRPQPDGRGRPYPISHLQLVGKADKLVQEILWLHQPTECDNVRCGSATPGFHCTSDCVNNDGGDGDYPCPTVLAIRTALGGGA